MRISSSLLSNFLVGSLLLTSFKISAQTPCWANCDNMLTKNLSYSVTSTRIAYGYAGTDSAQYYSDVEYRDQSANYTDCGIDNDNNLNDVDCRTNLDGYLKYDVYYPDNYSNYSQCPLPPVILFHPGGYSDCFGAFGDLMEEYCTVFASKDFVCFNVEYRAGRLVDPAGTLTAQQILAIYRAFQDGRGAIRSIIKRQQNHSSWNDPYQIDINNMVVGGASAGGAIALSLAYYPTQSMINQVVKNDDVEDALGPIDMDFYYGETSIEYYSRIKGVINMWSNAFLPVSYYNNPWGFFDDNTIFPQLYRFMDRTIMLRIQAT